jgi:hypothetical protein
VRNNIWKALAVTVVLAIALAVVATAFAGGAQDRGGKGGPIMLAAGPGHVVYASYVRTRPAGLVISLGSHHRHHKHHKHHVRRHH